jgi:hypothetical protein
MCNIYCRYFHLVLDWFRFENACLLPLKLSYYL